MTERTTTKSVVRNIKHGAQLAVFAYAGVQCAKGFYWMAHDITEVISEKIKDRKEAKEL